MLRRILSSLALFALAGCAATPAAVRTIAIDSPTPRATPEPPPATRTFLVWTEREDGPVTRLVSVGAGAPATIAETRGAIFTFEDRAYRFDTRATPVKLYGCDGGGGSPPALTEGAEWHTPVIEDLADGSVRTFDAADASGTEGVNQLEQTARLRATLGPYVFVTDSQWVYACGAHGSSSSASVVWDLRTGTTTRFVDDTAYPSEKEEARKALDDPDRGWDDPLPASDVTLVEALPFVEPAHTGLHLRFVAPACYACSDDWASYSRSTIVDVPLRPELANWAKPLPWLAGYLAEHGEETLGGVTQVDVQKIAGLGRALGLADHEGRGELR